MKKTSQKTLMTGKAATRFCLLCCLAYFASYATRSNYSAVLVEIVEDLGITKDLGGIAVTGSFVTYGIGQIVMGCFSDRLQPKFILLTGLIGTSVINICMFFLPNIYIMAAFWCVNGVFQSMMWPPIARLLADNLGEKDYNRGCVWVSSTISIGTLSEYLIASAIVSVSSWRVVFAVSSVVGFAVAMIWAFFTRNIRSESKTQRKCDEKSQSNDGFFKVIRRSGLIAVGLCIVGQGVLRDGISTWLPSYVNDIFSLGSSKSILTAVILPIFAVISVNLASKLYHKMKNAIIVVSLLFGVAMACSLIMLPFFKSSIVVSIVMMAIITGTMHGINHIVVSYIPFGFKKYGKVSTVSGSINACAYLGSAISTYGFAVFSEKYGWYFIIVSWVLLAAMGLLGSLLTTKKWKNFEAENRITQ